MSFNAPPHELEAQYVELLVPYCVCATPTESRKHALGVARTLLELFEKTYRRELEAASS